MWHIAYLVIFNVYCTYIISYFMFQILHIQPLIFTKNMLAFGYIYIYICAYDLHSKLLNEHRIELNVYIRYIKIHRWHWVIYIYYNATVTCPFVQRDLHHDRAMHPNKAMFRTWVPEETTKHNVPDMGPKQVTPNTQGARDAPQKSQTKPMCRICAPTKSANTNNV